MTALSEVVLKDTKNILRGSSFGFKNLLNFINHAMKFHNHHHTIPRTVPRTQIPVARTQIPVARTQIPVARTNGPVARAQIPVARASPAPVSRAPASTSNAPIPVPRAPASTSNAPILPVPRAPASAPIVPRVSVAEPIAPVSVPRTVQRVHVPKAPVAPARTPATTENTFGFSDDTFGFSFSRAQARVPQQIQTTISRPQKARPQALPRKFEVIKPTTKNPKVY